MGTSTTIPGTLADNTFNGTSQFAGDIQQAIAHAVQVASIPLTELQDNQTTLQGQQTEISTLEGKFSALQTALTSLNSAAGGGSLSASVADPTIATASIDPSVAIGSGTYDVNVVSPGAQTITFSNAGATVTDPTSTSISTSGSYTLTVGTSTSTITPTSNTLDALAQAINSAGAGVSATLVNVGSPSSPDYRLSLASTTLQNETLQLNDGSQDLLETLVTGSEASYTVDGQPAPPASPIQSTSNTVTVAPGVTATLLQAGDTTIQVAPDTSQAESALSAFASAYNAATAELTVNHGTGGGALTGQALVSQLQQSLSSILNYSGGGGSVQHLSDLGLTFDSTGNLQFNSATFEAAEASDPTDVAGFLGSTTGTGFLATASKALTTLTDPLNGVFQSANASLQTQINQDMSEITDTTNRINNMQSTLISQMSAADAAIATLESQVTYYTTLFTDQRDASVSGA